MPYLYQLKNRQRAKQAILAAVLLAFVLALLVFTPARILGWAGLGFGSLTVPAATVAAVDEPLAVALTKVRTPPLVEPYTFPAYTEWSDIEIACSDCVRKKRSNLSQASGWRRLAANGGCRSCR